jgi:hypothetical protein
MAMLSSRVTRAVVGALVAGTIGVAIGMHSVAATTPPTTSGTDQNQASAFGTATSLAGDEQSPTASPQATATAIPTRVMPTPTATPNCLALPATYSHGGTVIGPPSSTSFPFRQHYNGCIVTIVVQSSTAITIITNGTPTPNQTISQITQGMSGTVHGTGHSDGTVTATSITLDD